MLILTRRVKERIFIGDKITVTVMEISPSQVKLGIHAPPNVTILREEVRKDAMLHRGQSAPEPKSP